MSKLRLPYADRLSSVPDIDREATGWAQVVVDTLMRWANGGIDGSNIAISSVPGSDLDWNVGATPPSAPADNDLWVYNGNVSLHTGTQKAWWPFMYDSSEATYKWKAIGPTAVYDVVDTDETVTADTTWRDPTTAGPTITVPFAGDYDYTMSMACYNTGAAGAYTNETGLTKNGTNPASPHILEIYTGMGGGGIEVTSERSNPYLGLAASDVLKMKYLATTAVAHFRYRYLKIVPRRVSA